MSPYYIWRLQRSTMRNANSKACFPHTALQPDLHSLMPEPQGEGYGARQLKSYRRLRAQGACSFGDDRTEPHQQ